jgi:molybdenum cofactor sulfurtransferase
MVDTLQRTPAEATFLDAHPRYAADAVRRLRGAEYARLDAQHHTYLDYTGGSLYAESQLRAHFELLSGSVFGNPHSGNPASQLMTRLAERARRAVLAFFNADPDVYEVIFTPNATGALRLVGEAYPFSCGSRFLLTADNHNSVNGIREFARRAGAQIAYAPLCPTDLRADSSALERLIARPAFDTQLFAFPAQSNFSGVQHPLEWIDFARRHGWDVLLDASAYVPTNRLDLGQWQPDFAAVSFYKMFGYPTGVGALIARKSALRKLRRPWFAGGTITFSSVCAAHDAGNGYYLTPGSAGFEDGTVNYLSLPAVEEGLRWVDGVGIGAIHARVTALADWLLAALQQLRHANGRPLVQVYGPRDMSGRGASVALNVLDADGRMWDCWRVEALANARQISLRAGCHCNPGAREVALELTQAGLARAFARKDEQSYDDFLRDIRDEVAGVVRVSLGIASTFGDVHTFVEFLREFANCRAE